MASKSQFWKIVIGVPFLVTQLNRAFVSIQGWQVKTLEDAVLFQLMFMPYKLHKSWTWPLPVCSKRTIRPSRFCILSSCTRFWTGIRIWYCKFCCCPCCTLRMSSVVKVMGLAGALQKRKKKYLKKRERERGVTFKDELFSGFHNIRIHCWASVDLSEGRTALAPVLSWALHLSPDWARKKITKLFSRLVIWCSKVVSLFCQVVLLVSFDSEWVENRGLNSYENWRVCLKVARH